MKILWLSLIIQCRCKEISINTFQKPSSTVSASKFEIFVRNILSAYIWLDLNVLGSKKSISMNQIIKFNTSSNFEADTLEDGFWNVLILISLHLYESLTHVEPLRPYSLLRLSVSSFVKNFPSSEAQFVTSVALVTSLRVVLIEVASQ